MCKQKATGVAGTVVILVVTVDQADQNGPNHTRRWGRAGWGRCAQGRWRTIPVRAASAKGQTTFRVSHRGHARGSKNGSSPSPISTNRRTASGRPGRSSCLRRHRGGSLYIVAVGTKRAAQCRRGERRPSAWIWPDALLAPRHPNIKTYQRASLSHGGCRLAGASRTPMTQRRLGPVLGCARILSGCWVLEDEGQGHRR